MPAPKKILITGAGGRAAVTFISSLTDPGLELHAADADPYAPGLYLVTPGRRHLLPSGRHPEYVSTLLALCVKNGFDAVVPTVEADLLRLSSVRAEFARAGIRLLCGRESTLVACRDRWELLQACAFDVSVPKTGLWTDQLRWSDSFPCIVKPRFRASGRSPIRIEDRAKLNAQPRSANLLLQEYLPGEDVSVEVFVGANGAIHGVVPIRRLKVVSGLTLTAQTVFDRGLIKLACQVVRTMHLRGAAHIEFRRDRYGMARLLDVTPCFVGDMALATRAGVNIPQLAMDELFDRELPNDTLRFQEIAMTYTLQSTLVPAPDIAAMEQQRTAANTI